jgi:hypothetical protein
MNDGERYAWERIIDAMDAIKDIENFEDGFETGRTLIYNNQELAEAVHVLQSFVKQHILHGLYPGEFSDWWGERDGEER